MITDEDDRRLFKRLDRESLNTILLLKHNSDEVSGIELTNAYQNMNDIDDDSSIEEEEEEGNKSS